MSALIHPTAIISDDATLGENVEVGPYCVIDAHVSIGNDCKLFSHVTISGHTTIGNHNTFFPFSSIGKEPQDLKYHGEPAELVIGDDNTFRESVTVNIGTEGGGMLTKIGNGCFLMATAHVAHDCLLGNNIIIANATILAGHICVDDDAIIGGMSAVHQFLRIGRGSMVGGMSGVLKDIPPYCLAAGGYRPNLSGLNVVGLKRRGVAVESIAVMKKVYRVLFKSCDKLESRLAEAEGVAAGNEYAMHMIDFVRSSERGITMHGRD